MVAHQKVIGRVRNGWLMNTENMGNFGTDYLKRASVELAGLGANLQEDAIYPLAFVDGAGHPLTGKNRYVLHFEKKDLPPVRAFWSVTLYDDEGFQVANELDRFAIGDRDSLVYNADGSLDLLVQHEAPSGDKKRNWLPAPAGLFNLCMRLYYPKPEALDGRWLPPDFARRAPSRPRRWRRPREGENDVVVNAGVGRASHLDVAGAWVSDQVVHDGNVDPDSTFEHGNGEAIEAVVTNRQTVGCRAGDTDAALV